MHGRKKEKKCFVDFGDRIDGTGVDRCRAPRPRNKHNNLNNKIKS